MSPRFPHSTPKNLRFADKYTSENFERTKRENSRRTKTILSHLVPVKFLQFYRYFFTRNTAELILTDKSRIENPKKDFRVLFYPLIFKNTFWWIFFQHTSRPEVSKQLPRDTWEKLCVTAFNKNVNTWLFIIWLISVIKDIFQRFFLLFFFFLRGALPKVFKYRKDCFRMERKKKNEHTLHLEQATLF